MAKTTKLSLHRNTLSKKRRKEMQDHMVSAAKHGGSQDVRAFALVTIRADGSVWSEWDTGSIMPMWAFAPTIFEALKRDLEESGVSETWCPDLSERH